MTPVTFLKSLTLLAFFWTTSAANAAVGRGVENSTLHIGLRVLSGCELRTMPPRASCSHGTPIAIAQPGRATDAPVVTGTGQDAAALAGPTPAGSARMLTIAF